MTLEVSTIWDFPAHEPTAGLSEAPVGASKDNLHARAEESGGVRLGGVGGMNRDFEVRADPEALRKTKAVKRLEHAFVTLAGEVRLAVVECGSEHVSPSPEGVDAGQAESVDVFNGRSLRGAEGESSEWRPAVG